MFLVQLVSKAAHDDSHVDDEDDDCDDRLISEATFLNPLALLLFLVITLIHHSMVKHRTADDVMICYVST